MVYGKIERLYYFQFTTYKKEYFLGFLGAETLFGILWFSRFITHLNKNLLGCMIGSIFGIFPGFSLEMQGYWQCVA